MISHEATGFWTAVCTRQGCFVSRWLAVANEKPHRNTSSEQQQTTTRHEKTKQPIQNHVILSCSLAGDQKPGNNNPSKPNGGIIAYHIIRTNTSKTKNWKLTLIMPRWEGALSIQKLRSISLSFSLRHKNELVHTTSYSYQADFVRTTLRLVVRIRTN